MKNNTTTLFDLPLSRLLEIQADADAFLQKYAILPPMEKVRLQLMGLYPLLLEAIEQKKVEAEENKAIQQQALADAEAEELADEGRLFWLSANDLHAGQINIGQ